MRVLSVKTSKLGIFLKKSRGQNIHIFVEALGQNPHQFREIAWPLVHYTTPALVAFIRDGGFLAALLSNRLIA